VRDDHPLLLRGELREKAEAVAAASVTFEEWAASALEADPDGVPRIAAGPARALLHGHCHQKALVGLGPTLRLLSRIPGLEVVDADAGCCGMAGSFGYEREHYSISKAVGERKLFPAIAGEGPDTAVIAPGFSCRQQIRHFTDARPVSVMELLEPLVGDDGGRSHPDRGGANHSEGGLNGGGRSHPDRGGAGHSEEGLN
jgi:Fe-S oxidoreductase